jgi:RimJ/RimL family protein N-acetyltransferase
MTMSVAPHRVERMSDDDVRIEAWTEADLPVLERNDTPEMTRFLGGPEGPEKLRRRHETLFLEAQHAGIAHPFTVWARGEPEAVGSVAYWNSQHAGAEVYECGWAIATRYQSRGYARRGIRLVLEHAATHGGRELIYAFPRIDNGPSNALAERAGFTNTGVEDFEYPKGVPIKTNAWVFDLRTLRGVSAASGR